MNAASQAPDGAAGENPAGTITVTRHGFATTEGSHIVLEQCTVGSARARRLELRRSAARELTGEATRLFLSAVRRLRCARCVLRTSAVARVQADHVRVERSAVALTVAGSASLSQADPLVVVGREVTVSDARPVLLVTNVVQGQVRPLLDARSATALGLTIGLALAAVALLRTEIQR